MKEVKKENCNNGEAPLLRVRSLSKAFGGVQAQKDISFAIDPGSITGLIGPNGAGKTTLFNLITGIFPPDSGTIDFNGRDMAACKVHQRVAAGIARTFQNVELFGSMTVLENVLVGLHVRTRSGMWGALTRLPWVKREEREARANAMELLEFVGLTDLAHAPSRDLAFGWQRLLEIARALASRPQLLLLDEPAAGLNAVETRALADLIGRIRDRGVTTLLVEHDMNLTMEICDNIIVLDQGRKIAEGPPRRIQEDEAVMEAYLGFGANCATG